MDKVTVSFDGCPAVDVIKGANGRVQFSVPAGGGSQPFGELEPFGPNFQFARLGQPTGVSTDEVDKIRVSGMVNA